MLITRPVTFCRPAFCEAQLASSAQAKNVVYRAARIIYLHVAEFEIPLGIAHHYTLKRGKNQAVRKSRESLVIHVSFNFCGTAQAVNIILCCGTELLLLQLLFYLVFSRRFLAGRNRDFII